MSIMLLLCSTNTHSVVHDKSRSTLQLNKGKSNYFQKLLRCLSGTVTYTIKVSTGVVLVRWHLLNLPSESFTLTTSSKY